MLRLFALAVLASLCLSVQPSPAAASERPPLARGVNLSHWLTHWGRQPIRPVDMELIRSAGFDHVRVPFNPEYLGWQFADSDPEVPMPEIEKLDDAVRWGTRAGLTVLIDVHPSDEAHHAFEFDASARAALLDLWRFLARRYADVPPDALVFELLNEPHFYERGPEEWNAFQGEMVAAVRELAPERELILTGPFGSSIEGLEEVQPISDDKVRYAFHFYEPYLLTHLGAVWEPFASGAYMMLENLPYPADSEAVNEIRILPGARRRDALSAIRRYATESWDAGKIEARIREAAAWAQEHGVEIVCTEFGLIRHAPHSTGSRYRYLRDLRKAFETHGIGWTVFDFADIFGIAYGVGDVEQVADGGVLMNDPITGRRELDPVAMEALGMN